MLSFFRKLHLQGKFFSYFTGLVIMVVFFISLAIYFFQKRVLLNEAKEKAFSLNRSLAYTSLNAILQDDYIVLQTLIDSMMDSPDIISVAILDTNGRVIASSTPEMRGEEQLDSLSRKAISSETFLLQKIPEVNNREMWDTAVPIFNLNQRIGTARIKFSVEDVFHGLLEMIIGIGLIAILSSMAVSYQFSRSISKPILSAVNLANEYGKGNLDAVISLNREDEIGQLVSSLNKLSVELKTLIEEKISNENLVIMGEFASYIIHDLKNPLSGIHLLCDGLNRQIPSESPLKRYSNEILLASQKLHDFIRRTLDVARWSKINPQPIMVNSLIEHAINDTNFQGYSIQKDYAPDMPQIYGDYQMLLMVIKNLLSNAIEALNGGGEVFVKTSWNGKATIIISDNGCGIPEERLKTIFRPFFSMKKHGHGLGLSMVKKALMLHHGKIEVESMVGKGSSFTITLPGNL